MIQNENLNLQDEISEAEKSVEEATDLLNKIGGNQENAKALIDNLSSNEKMSEIKTNLGPSMENKIGEIRKMSREQMSEPQNAIVLQTYAVLFMDKTAADIGGIDGKFGPKTLQILKHCQKEGIGGDKNSYVKEIGSSKKDKEKDRSEITIKNNEIDKSKEVQNILKNIPEKIEGEKQDENEVTYVSNKLKIVQKVKEIEGIKYKSHEIQGEPDYINWAEEFNSSELFDGIPITNQEVENIEGINILSFDFDDSFGNEDYNKRNIKVPENITQDQINKLIAGEIKEAVEEKRIFDLLNNDIKGKGLKIPEGLEKIQMEKGLIQLENLNFSTDFMGSGEQIRYLEFDFDSEGLFDKVDNNKTYRVKIDDLKDIKEPVEIINKILEIKELEIRQNIEGVEIKKEQKKKERTKSAKIREEMIKNIPNDI